MSFSLSPLIPFPFLSLFLSLLFFLLRWLRSGCSREREREGKEQGEEEERIELAFRVVSPLCLRAPEREREWDVGIEGVRGHGDPFQV